MTEKVQNLSNEEAKEYGIMVGEGVEIKKSATAVSGFGTRQSDLLRESR
jgi:hypothetical protein